MVVADTGFLSSLLKVNRAELILKVFEVDVLFIPIQVLRELEKSPFFHDFAGLFTYTATKESWIQVIPVEIEESEEFGQGELASIKIAKEKNCLLLIDDKKAMTKAKKEGVSTLSLSGFLLLCKEAGILSKIELRSVLDDLEKKDYYRFSKEIENLILADV